MRIRLTEEELKGVINNVITEYYNSFKGMMCETMHYPEFLDIFKSDITVRILEKLESGNTDKPFYVSAGENKYVRFIQVFPSVLSDNDIDNDFKYSAAYDSLDTRFSDGKLIIGRLYLRFPVSDEGRINTGLIRETIIHELNHLYDDWRHRKSMEERGLPITALSDNKKTEDINDALTDSHLIDLSVLSYFNIKTETSAFLSAIPNELDRCGVTKNNVSAVSRETTTYLQIHRAYVGALNSIKRWEGGFLEYINKLVSEKYSDSGIPFIKGGFNEEKYKGMLKDWCDSVYTKFIKKYYKVVKYYLDKKEKMKEKIFEFHDIWRNPETVESFKFDYRRGLGFEDIGKTAGTKKTSL